MRRLWIGYHFNSVIIQRKCKNHDNKPILWRVLAPKWLQHLNRHFVVLGFDSYLELCLAIKSWHLPITHMHFAEGAFPSYSFYEGVLKSGILDEYDLLWVILFAVARSVRISRARRKTWDSYTNATYLEFKFTNWKEIRKRKKIKSCKIFCKKYLLETYCLAFPIKKDHSRPIISFVQLIYSLGVGKSQSCEPLLF